MARLIISKQSTAPALSLHVDGDHDNVTFTVYNAGIYL